MIGALFLAVIKADPSAAGSTPAATPAASLAPATPPAGLAPTGTPEVPIRDILPPVDIPYAWWQIALFVLVIGGALGWLLWTVISNWPKAVPPPPPSPRKTAMEALEKLRPQVESLEPYAFSIAVSDILRSYIQMQYGLAALKQTSPEFLASLERTIHFTTSERHLLSAFLERCDMLKFARMEADSRMNEALLTSAIDFVQGGPA